MAEITDTSFAMLLEISADGRVGKVGGFIIGKDDVGDDLGGM